MRTGELDLLITARRMICPSGGIDGPGAIGTVDGVISFVATGSLKAPMPSARKTLSVDDGILMPGLVDLHAHPAMGGSRFGVDPDVNLLPKGSTTVLSQGDAGARNLDTYIRNTIEASWTRIKLAINFCANGESNPDGRFFTMDEANVGECVEAIKRGGSHIWGISLNIAFIRGKGVAPLEVMRRGMIAAEKTDRPVMFGATKSSDTPLADQLKLLRSGDVMTYCFHSGEGSIVEDGRVQDCVWEARERGVLFDVGDGATAFGFDVAETAIGEGFIPDTISSDFYRYHVDAGGDYDVPLVVSKLIAVGMTEEQCWPRITSSPARTLGMDGEIGRLAPGAQADLCVLRPGPSPETLRDGDGKERLGHRWRPTATFKSGELVSLTQNL